jgi:hypothetical protein
VGIGEGFGELAPYVAIGHLLLIPWSSDSFAPHAVKLNIPNYSNVVGELQL